MPSDQRDIEQNAASSSPLFHPGFPHHWQVKSRGPIRPSSTPGVGQPEMTNQSGGRSGTSVQERNQPPWIVLLPEQVVQGKEWGSGWIRTHEGFFLSRSDVTPYWPVYRVVGESSAGTGGVAPYVVVPSTTTRRHQPNAGASRQAVLPTLMARNSEYDADSSLRRTDLSKPVGHIFEHPAKRTILPNEYKDDPPIRHNWWTADGQTWWPETVGAMIPVLDTPIPSWVPIVSKKAVTEWVAPVDATFICHGMQDGRGWYVVSMIAAEYLMIVVGATAGIEYGWSIPLQLLYLCGLIALVFCEIALVARLIPNGRLWVRMNKSKLPIAVLQGVLWRWDLYSDVGFCILAYQERNRIASQFWVAPTVLTTFVIVGRLGACFYYLRKLQFDEVTLSKVSVPSFLTVFALLCQGLQLSDSTLALTSARTELLFETLRTLIEDFPEIVFQAVYLFGPNAPPTCTDCAYGFVLMSLFASIATSCPGLVRLRKAFVRYTTVRSEILNNNSNSSNSMGKRTAAEPTERLNAA